MSETGTLLKAEFVDRRENPPNPKVGKDLSGSLSSTPPELVETLEGDHVASLLIDGGATPQATGPSNPENPPLPSSDSWSKALRVEETERLIANYHQDVFAYARWLCRCDNGAEDITQVTFLNAFRGIHKLRDRAAEKSWLMTIARNEFIAWCKKSKTDVELPERLASPGTSTELRAENTDWVEHALGQLSTEFRIVVLMYYYEQRSYTEIAEHLEIPLGTVMSRLSRAKSQLREAWQTLHNPEEA